MILNLKVSCTMKASEVYASAYVKASELPAEPVTLTIQAVAKENVKNDDGSKQDKLVLRFQGAKKRLVLNTTNCGFLCAHLGDETDLWIGRQVVVAKVKVPYQGGMVDAIRIVDYVPLATPPQAGKQEGPTHAPKTPGF